MASKGSSAATQAPENPAPLPKVRPPEGFADEGRPDIDGWLKPVDGLVIHGKICGFFQFIQRMRDGTNKVRQALCVTLVQPMKASTKGGVAVDLAKGQVLAMSMMYCLEPLKVYIENRGEIWVQFKSKQPIGGGQTVWKADVFGKGKKSAVPILTAPMQNTGSSTENEDAEPWDN